ncbi:Cytochrome b-c1 complex subunit 9 [Dillenia turbinata]|uniref:Complex III subunit 9 n=1 Tax=Dillenia turbinata TaxID=194707 RepID=A0AAN8ZIK6_9MAGN
MASAARASAGGGLFEGLYKVIMRRNSVYVTFVVAGAFLGERAVDYGVKKLWESQNVGVGLEILHLVIRLGITETGQLDLWIHCGILFLVTALRALLQLLRTMFQNDMKTSLSWAQESQRNELLPTLSFWLCGSWNEL